MSSILVQDPIKVMRSNGKSFFFASLFFSKKQLRSIAKLYQICRYIDDCADELDPEQSRVIIHKLKAELLEHSIDSEFQRAVDDVRNLGVTSESIQELLRGAESDLTGVRISDQKEFLRYCFSVAGVVGLMMCPLLGCKDQAAYPFATDLGIGMQITNICRDVLEDAQMGRIYFSKTVLDRFQCEKISPENQQTPWELKKVVEYYLDLADEFYESAYGGLSLLPLRSRLCIVLAGEVYRHIGVKIRKKDYDVLRGRIFLSLREKIWVAFKSIRFFVEPRFWRAKTHQAVAADFRLEWA